MHRHISLITRQLLARPRLLLSILTGLVVGILLDQWFPSRNTTQWLLAWNAGTWLYLLLSLGMIVNASQKTIRRRAARQDEGQKVVLTLVIIAAIASLAAIVAELAVVKDMTGFVRYSHIGLAAVTVIASWVFIHLMFAQHYAHDYFMDIARGGDGGLEFPGKDSPDYWDFLYFAFIIGTSGQTADISFTSRSMRKTGLLHCVLAFMFNTTLLAMTINIAASLF